MKLANAEAIGEPVDWLHGVQLAAAVIVGYAVPTLLGLPGGTWAVMSALIVMRPSAGSTLGAGTERLKGTIAGAACGLAGAALSHIGVDPLVGSLGIVALLALSSAWLPAMRSAPITALIVLSGSVIAGETALHVAGLRVLEIGIGVAIGFAISMTGAVTRAGARFDAACVATLKLITAGVAEDLSGRTMSAEQKTNRAVALRQALRKLAVLAVGADHEARLRLTSRRSSPDGEPQTLDKAASTARLMARTAHDANAFGRLADSTPLARDHEAWKALNAALVDSLDATQRAMEGSAPPELTALRRHASNTVAPIPWLAPAVRLLLQDLTGLTRQR